MCVHMIVGMCVSTWGEHLLDGHSFEGVQRILEADADTTEVKVGFMKCRYVNIHSWLCYSGRCGLSHYCELQSLAQLEL